MTEDAGIAVEDEDDPTAPSRNPPAAIKRALFEESGYRCAVPHCRETIALEMAHIIPWSEVKEHHFENMIVLCHPDHWRYDKTREIPRSSILAYKRNMAVINGRFNDFERRLLEMLHERGGGPVTLDYSPSTELHLRNVLRDQLVVVTTTPGSSSQIETADGGMFIVSGMVFADDDRPAADLSGAIRRSGSDDYMLSPAGKVLVDKWFGAAEIDATISA